MARNTKIQFRRGTQSEWNLSGASLSPGELGYEIDTGRFKIGQSGVALWSLLPYAGGSTLISNTGIGFTFDQSANAYNLYSYITGIQGGQDGITFETLPLSGLLNNVNASGTYYRIGLSSKLENFQDLSGNGIVVQSGSTFQIRSLASGNNITIQNANGVSANPIIGLSSSLTGLSSISGNNGFTIATNNGMVLDAGDGEVVVDDLKVNGMLTVGTGIDILLSAEIIAHGSIVYSGNPTRFKGDVYFDETPYVGPTGGTLGVDLFPVSVSGHSHTISDIADFCDGVSDCVSTSLVASTGLQFNYDGSSLKLALSGQALELHKFNSNGILVRTSQDTFSARTISSSGSNILIGSGNGVDGNPVIGLNPNISVTSITTTNSATIGTDLTVQGNLLVNGDTITTNVSTIVVEDPSIKLGQPSGNFDVADQKDRGVEFVYQTGNAVGITGFFGYDHSADSFVFLDHATNNNGIYTGTSSTINIGAVYSSGPISGTILSSTVSSPTPPISVSSTGLINNLNSDLLDGNHGDYYRNWSSISGLATPTYTVTLTGDVSGTVTTSPITLGNNISLSVATTLNGINSVELGVETTGQYARTISVAGTGLSVTTPNSSGTNYTITSNATPVCSTGTIVARDSSGNFCANQINVSNISGTNNIIVPTGGSTTPTYASTSISGSLYNDNEFATYLIHFVIDGGSP